MRQADRRVYDVADSEEVKIFKQEASNLEWGAFQKHYYGSK